jgi:hypothetical protein
MLNLLSLSSIFSPTPQSYQAARLRNLHSPFLPAILFPFRVDISPCLNIDILPTSPVCFLPSAPIGQLLKPPNPTLGIFFLKVLIFLFQNSRSI